MTDRWTPETPWFGPDKKTEKVWPRYVCRNAACKSVGRSHPHCQCGPPSIRSQYKNLEYDAAGGEVGSHFCESGNSHHPDCEHYADGGEIAANQEFMQNPDLAIDHSVISHGLHHLLTKTGHTRSEEPGRVMRDHLDHNHSGKKALHGHSKNILETKKEHHIKPNPEHTEALKSHLEDLRANPNKLLELGGAMNDVLPGHAGAIGAKAAAIMNHLEIIRPKSSQPNPMSQPIAPSKMEETKYNRQIAVMQNPMIAYQGIKEGRIQPDDLNTIQVVYPKLFERMKTQLMESIIEAKANGKEISYKHRLGLSQALGQPLDFSMSPEAAQAIILANAGAQQQAPAGKPKQTSAAVLKQMNKVDDMAATPLERSQLDHKT